jgi:hypothetical protein
VGPRRPRVWLRAVGEWPGHPLRVAERLAERRSDPKRNALQGCVWEREADGVEVRRRAYSSSPLHRGTGCDRLRPGTARRSLCVGSYVVDVVSTSAMSTIILRGGVEVENPLELALEFLAAYSSREAGDSSRPASFGESDLRLANRGGARISTTEIAAILERRGEIERALRKVHPEASLADATSSIPWIPLTRLFEAFADIRGIGFSKMTKALHRKRPALIPMLDSVVQAYLTRDDSGTPSSGSFGERATALVRSYKRDLDRNRSALHEIQEELTSREYRLTEVRILDLLIWSVSAAN